MEVQSQLKYAKVSSQKVRLVINQIRGCAVSSALNVLNFSRKKSSKFIKNVLVSAIANAEHNNNLDIDQLYVSSAYANEGPTVKRSLARAKGRSNQILKRTSHIVVKVSEKSNGLEK